VNIDEKERLLVKKILTFGQNLTRISSLAVVKVNQSTMQSFDPHLIFTACLHNRTENN
jgi:hypothetical protein